MLVLCISVTKAKMSVGRLLVSAWARSCGRVAIAARILQSEYGQKELEATKQFIGVGSRD
jgi:hypothetical protein